MPVTELRVFRALAELCLLGRIGHSEIKILPLVLGYWTVPAALVHVMFRAFNKPYTGFIPDSTSCPYFYIFTFYWPRIQVNMGNFKDCLLFAGTETWPLGPHMWFFINLNDDNLASLWWFSLLVSLTASCFVYKLLSKSIFQKVKEIQHSYCSEIAIIDYSICQFLQRQRYIYIMSLVLKSDAPFLRMQEGKHGCETQRWKMNVDGRKHFEPYISCSCIIYHYANEWFVYWLSKWYASLLDKKINIRPRQNKFASQASILCLFVFLFVWFFFNNRKLIIYDTIYTIPVLLYNGKNSFCWKHITRFIRSWITWCRWRCGANGGFRKLSGKFESNFCQPRETGTCRGAGNIAAPETKHIEYPEQLKTSGKCRRNVTGMETVRQGGK